ncbi:putative transporter YcgH [Thalassobacillus devorans]|uniref:Transporter YcgH n=1 Tax=Thalassobacillus devorans TaxID=279813 RepID=A0ABQ1PPR0_9BACI|nr:amino acid permease [Thalassobacillus devorans]NIK30416.1 L-asparagine transporter-like permease [Thalassobacillus devorans]GGD00448.1 putative transporter YcgH [Thalassobacillus devorans]
MDKNQGDSHKKIPWWQLTLIGVGCTIGTGFFLGSALAIKQGGPAAIFTFLLAAAGTYIVFDALARMTAEHPEKGSFRTYAKKAYGRWAGFSTGWVYWTSELLIMGSQLTALAIFSKFWFPGMPLWLLSAIFGVLGIGVIITGVSGFERFENIFAVVKTAAIVMFIIIAALAVTGALDGGRPERTFEWSGEGLFPAGMTGLWAALIYAFYAFGGIEVMGIMANELKEPKEAPKSGKVMLVLLAVIYVASLGLAVFLVSWDKFNPDESPFITALAKYDLAFVPHVFNGALIIGGFSTMVASLYAITTILSTLAEDKDAPAFFAKTGKRGVPYHALFLTITGLIASIVVALLLPEKVYEYLTTAAGLMLLYTWIFILFSYNKLVDLPATAKIKRWIGFVLIAAAVSGTLLDGSSRIGFFISLLFLVVIALVALLMRKKWKEEPS